MVFIMKKSVTFYRNEQNLLAYKEGIIESVVKIISELNDLMKKNSS
jgi:hypothetical protein